jgi:uncharacterized membrane protein
MSSRTSLVLRKVASPFLTGLLAILPLALTVAIISWLASFLIHYIGPGSAVGRAMEGIGLAFISDERVAYVVGIVTILVVVYLLGLIVQVGLREQFQRVVNGLVSRLPLVRNVYDAIEKVLSMFGKDQKTDLSGMSPVFCYFGGEGGAGVLALMPSPERFLIDGHEYHAVLVPSAPVPFGGGLIYVPVDWVKPADFSVDGLLAIYVSMGAASGQYIAKDTSR